jgi:HK97 family phage portal protein
MLKRLGQSLAAFLLAPTTRKSIPLIPRFSDSEWQFLGTTRSKTFLQVVGGNKVTDPYASNPWVRGAIESIAMNISGTPIMWMNSRDQVASPQDSAKWDRLFQKPNDQMGLQQLIEATLIHLLLWGECMWVLDRKEPTAIPAGIIPYAGPMFEPIINTASKIVGWKYDTSDGKTIPFNTWEVVFFKMYNPYDPIRGLSPIQAAQLGIDQDNMASQYNKAFFMNSALPGGVIEIDEELSDETFNRMKQQFQDHHGGVNKAHMMAILEGGAKYKQLVPSQKDMEFLQQKHWNRDEILACYKVPKLELGVWEGVNFAVAKVQSREFWVKTLVPKMRLLEHIMWAQLFSLTSTGNIYLKFDVSKVDALQAEVNEKIDMAFKLWQMGASLNEMIDRFELNIPKTDAGNARFVTNNVFPIDDNGKLLPLPAPPVPPGQPQGAGKPKPSNAPKAPASKGYEDDTEI